MVTSSARGETALDRGRLRSSTSGMEAADTSRRIPDTAHRPASAEAPAHATKLDGLDKFLAWTTEGIAAILVAVETVVLFVGVVARYAFDRPLTWSDELASIIFIWLAMFGAIIALRRGEHMRMTAMAAIAGPRLRSLIDSFATTAPLVFLGAILVPAVEYALDERFITTPALQISGAWRTAALPVGIALMGLTSLLRLARDVSISDAAVSLAVIGLAGAAAFVAEPWVLAIGNWNLVVFFVGGVISAVLLGIPIGFSFGLATFAYLFIAADTPMTIVVNRIEEGMSHLVLLAVPLFVLLGLLLEITGMAKAIVQFLTNVLGHVRGGLTYGLVAAMYLVSGISGSKAADMAAVAPVLFPEMKARGARSGDLVALLAATGAQTETIPPSIVLITLGSVTGVSIAALFTGGLLPSLILAAALCFVIWLRYRKEDLSGVRRPAWREIARSFVVALPALVLPIFIRFAVVEGVATATEVSTIGIVYSMIVGVVIHRRLPLRELASALVSAASLSGAILFITGTATAMAWSLTQSGFSQDLARFMSNLPGGAAGFVALSIVAFILLGSFLEGVPAIILLAPLLFPIAQQVGVNEVHYAMVVIISMGIGLFAPPIGIGYYTACAVGRVDPNEGMRPIMGYMLAMLVGLILVAAAPWISTMLL